jgi:cell wall-associated NlpC family hydrolase
MGFTMTNGKDMTSVMYRMEGPPIFEQTLGSADAMLLRLLAGDETVGGSVFSAQSVETAANGRTVVRVSKNHLGTRYGSRRCRAFRQEDCSCHTKVVFKRFGHRLADSPVKQYKMNKGKRIGKKSNLRRGDLVFNDLTGGGMNSHFGDHVSIYVGNGWIIHASSYFNRVVKTKLKYLRGFEGGRRLRV